MSLSSGPFLLSAWRNLVNAVNVTDSGSAYPVPVEPMVLSRDVVRASSLVSERDF